MDSRNWINIIVLGFGFFLLFSAFQTTVFIQTLTISSYLSPKCNSKVNGSFGVLSDQKFADRVGYLSGAIIYMMVAIGNWVSVSIVAVVGAKWSLVVSGALYVVYIACLIRPLVYTVFIGAFILGAGGGVLWTAQGQVLIQNSSKERMGTTSGIFWFMLQSSLVVGSIYLFTYFYLENGDEHELDCFPHLQNNILFTILTCVAICGVVVLMFVTPKQRLSAGSSEGSLNTNTSGSEKDPLMHSRQTSIVLGRESSMQHHPIFQAIINAFKMLATKDMILLCITFVYTGYELNFWSGVYGTIVGHTLAFPKYYVGLALLFIGLGEIAGGGLFGILGSYTNRWGRDYIVLIGFIFHMIVYLCVFFYFPEKSISGDIAKEDSHGALGVMANPYVVMISAFLLGFGDACYNTQIYSLIGVMYPSDDKSAPAMALYKFFQSIAAMVGFFTSTILLLQWQLLILVLLGVVGTISFCIVEWEYFIWEEHRRRTLTLSYEDASSSVHYDVLPKTKTDVNVNSDENLSDSSTY